MTVRVYRVLIDDNKPITGATLASKLSELGDCVQVCGTWERDEYTDIVDGRIVCYLPTQTQGED